MDIKESEKVSTGLFGAVSQMDHGQVVFCHDCSFSS